MTGDGTHAFAAAREVELTRAGLPLQVALERIDAVDALAHDWRRLEAVADGSPFLSWHWVSAWLRMLPSQVQPLLFSARDAGGVVAFGLLIEVAETGVKRMFGNCSLHLQETGDPELDEITIEYAGLLVRSGQETRAYAALLELVNARFPSLRALHASGSIHGHWISDALPEGLSAYDLHADMSCYVDLDQVQALGGDYLKALSKSTRAGLRRTERAYAELGALEIEIAVDPGQALQWLDGLRELHTRYWEAKGEGGSFASAFFGEFHRELVREGTQAGFTQLMRITAGEHIVGYLYHLVWNDHVYFYSSGFDYGLAVAENRPGYLAQLLAIRRYAALGMRAYDFMAGESRYKRMMSTHARPMHNIRISPASWRLALERQVVEVARRGPPPPLLAVVDQGRAKALRHADAKPGRGTSAGGGQQV